MGVLVYLTTTRDGEAATRWLSWIEANRPCVTPRPGGGCLVYGPHRVCTDDDQQSCSITPNLWSLMNRVYQDLGVQRNAEMRTYAGSDEATLEGEVRTAATGYPLHLAAASILLKTLLNQSAANRARAASVLVERQPANLYFRFLKEGSSVELLENLYSLCPNPPDRTGGNRHQWSWERDTIEQPWLDSIGWDCIFLENLLKRPWTGTSESR